MMPWLLRFTIAGLMTMPATAHTDEMFTITAQSHVALGDGGDSFGMEAPDKQHVVILLNPDGEDCTLRFPLRQGEAFRMFVRQGLDQKLACEVSLNTTGKKDSATFTSRCIMAEPDGNPRCPSPN
jgi:hypothetical protein